MIEQHFIIGDKLDNEEHQYIDVIKAFISREFHHILQNEKFEECIIFNDPNRQCPMFCNKIENNMECNLIFLSAKSYNYWCQVIYQLSHEMTHYFIYIINNNIQSKISWVEESICEMMSLYFLQYFRDNWRECELSKYNYTYDSEIDNYLQKILNNRGEESLTKISDIEQLEEIDRLSEKDRGLRSYEVNRLFNFIKDYRDLEALLHYRNYSISNSVLLDSVKYMQKYKNNELVKYLCSLQQCCEEVAYEKNE
ncbi:hypothetical protein HF846_05090 [Clostridium cadaveris]|uniref:hypothetical protein n=1 Tax=Clostridium cadaveris TaxID=1529 RepID=UPI001459BAC6|nr:hypothetical protein [Clostridium cadaveris]NME63978.1 hypothetical protein [Clostridium cadaveris]